MLLSCCWKKPLIPFVAADRVFGRLRYIDYDEYLMASSEENTAIALAVNMWDLTSKVEDVRVLFEHIVNSVTVFPPISSSLHRYMNRQHRSSPFKASSSPPQTSSATTPHTQTQPPLSPSSTHPPASDNRASSVSTSESTKAIDPRIHS